MQGFNWQIALTTTLAAHASKECDDSPGHTHLSNLLPGPFVVCMLCSSVWHVDADAACALKRQGHELSHELVQLQLKSAKTILPMQTCTFNMHTCKCCTNIQVNTGLCLSYIMPSLAVMFECLLCMIPQFRMCLAALSMGCKRTQQIPNRRWNRAEFLLLWRRDMLTESNMWQLPA